MRSSYAKSLDAAEPAIAAKFAGQPTVEAAIRDTIRLDVLYLGRPADAIRQHERALLLRSESLGVRPSAIHLRP